MKLSCFSCEIFHTSVGPQEKHLIFKNPASATCKASLGWTRPANCS